MSYFLRKYFFIAVILAIVGYYFVARLPVLTLQPIFADEAIYIRWAQVMKSEPTLRFISLTDGKTPLFMWLLIPVFKLVSDPLLAGRLLSVFSGFVTLLGCLVLGWYFFNKRIGLWAAFLVASIPYLIFFDRMALVDSMLAAFGVWSVVLALMMVRFRRLDLAMILGFCLGGGMLTKTPGYFNVLMMPLVLITFPWKKTKKTWQRLHVLLLTGISILIAIFVYNLLRLGPGFSSLSSRNVDYIHPISRLWEIPFDPFMPHLRDIAEWFPIWLGWPVLFFVLVGIYQIIKTRNLVGWAILIWALVPLLIETALLKTFTTRYILSSIPLFLIIGSIGIDMLISRFKIRWLSYFIVLVLFIPSIWFVYKLQTDPENAPMPKESRRGYFEDWTSGYGLREIASFLNDRSKMNKIIIGTEGTFGTLPDGLWIYFDKNTNVVVTGGKGSFYQELRKGASETETYFVANKSRMADTGEGLELIMAFPKAKGQGELNDEMRLFRVLP